MVPFMRPGLIAGGMLAFTLSLDDFVITFFTSGPNTVTFPVKVYSMVRFSVTPEVNAASTILIVVTVALTAVALWMQHRSGTRSEEHTSELQSLMRISYAVFCLKKKSNTTPVLKTTTSFTHMS